MTRIFLTLAFVLLPLVAHAFPISIQLDEKELTKLSLEELKTLKLREVDFYNFVNKLTEKYRGVRLTEVMEHYPQLKGHTVVEVELVSLNGFRVYVPWNMVQKGNPLLVFERADGEKFVRYSQKEKMLVTLAPLYLVWDMRDVPMNERGLYSSTYQIHQINFVSNKVDFGVDASQAGDEIALGFRTYKHYCVSCHVIGKIGGDIGENLVTKQVLDRKGAEYVKNYILAPTQVNPKTHMLPLPAFNNREAMALGVVEFLRFIADPEAVLKSKEKNAPKERLERLKKILLEVRGSSVR